MIKNLYILALSLIAIAIHADNQQGIAYYKAGEPTIARQLFNKQLNASLPNKPKRSIIWEK